MPKDPAFTSHDPIGPMTSPGIAMVFASDAHHDGIGA